MARGYGNHLKWNEVAKLKADLMNVRHRWLGVSAHVLTQVGGSSSPAAVAVEATLKQAD